MPLTGVDLGLAQWLLCVAVGALLAVDAVTWLQIMVSRPVVSASLGGLLFGNPAAGFLVGALLEVVTLRHPPYGAARYPDTGPAGLIAGAAYAAAGVVGLGPLLAAVLAGWAIGWVGSRSVQLVRAANGRLVGDPRELAATPAKLTRRHRMAIRLDAARGGLMTALFLVPGVLGVRLVGTFAPGSGSAVPAAALAVLGLAAAAGAAARGLGAGVRRWPLFLAGAILAQVLRP